jgi:O-antigen ligase
MADGSFWVTAVERIREFDNDRRTLLVGAVLGAMLAVLMAFGVDARLSVLARVIQVVAFFAPTAGLIVMAALAVFREPSGGGALGFNAAVMGACALGVLVRPLLEAFARRRITVRTEFVGVGMFRGLSVAQFLALTTRFPAEREQFARLQLTDVCVALLPIVLIPVVFSARTRRYLIAAMIPGLLVAAVTAIASLSPSVIAFLPVWGLLPSIDESARGTGIYSNPNYLGFAMALGAVLLARGERLGLDIARWRSRVLVTPVLVAVLVSFSRGAFLALVGGIVALYTGRGRRVLAGALAVAGLVVLVGYPVLLGIRHELIFGPEIDASAAAQAVSDASRLAVHKAGLHLFLENPILGIGVGQFHYESPRFLKGSLITYSHDIYLQIAVEQGIVGFGAFLTMLAALVVALSRIGDDYAVTARAMLVVFAIGSLFAEPLTSPQSNLLLWIVVGAALVRPRPNEASDPPDSMRDRPIRPSLRDGWPPRSGIGFRG